MIALYPRVSTQEQAESGHSIAEQTERMKKYAEAMGWNDLKVYTDAGYSGGNMDRPALQALIKDVQAGKVEKVLVYKLDRLSRSQLDTLFLIEKVFLSNGCDFVSMSENFDTATPFGRAMMGILAVFAQLEREQIKERMKMGQEARAKMGLFHGSAQVPIGYDYVEGALVSNAFEQMQVKRIFEMYAGGMLAPTIAKNLNAEGLHHKNGKWIPYTVRQVLRKRTYLGEVQFNGKWYKGQHEACITEELFDKVQALLDARKEDALTKNRRAGKANSYLGGFLVCAHCGAKYIKHNQYSDRKGARVPLPKYICNSRAKKTPALVLNPECKNKIWNMQALDEIVFEQISMLSFEDDDRKEKQEPKDDDRITKAIASIDAQEARLMDLYAIGTVPVELISEKVRKLEEQKEQMLKEQERKAQQKKRLTLGEALPLAQSLQDILREGDLDAVRAVLSLLIDHIEVDGEDITIFWNF